jgi:hypothetical protein
MAALSGYSMFVDPLGQRRRALCLALIDPQPQ